MESSHCPLCQTVLQIRGRRERQVRKSEEEKEILIIRRLYCAKCDRLHHELPDCIVPYKRYGADVIERVINGKEAEQQTKRNTCGANTIRRLQGWWETVKPYFLNILLTLTARFGVSFGKPPAFKETVRAVANSNNWVFAHQLCTRSEVRRE
jgi:hypothetical protein